MENTQKLAQLIAQYPNANVMPMVDCDINLCGEYDSVCAEVDNCEYDEITIYYEDGVMYSKDNIGDLVYAVMVGENMTKEEASKYVENEMIWTPVILLHIKSIKQ